MFKVLLILLNNNFFIHIFVLYYLYRMAKRKKISKIDIISYFMNDVTQNKEIPTSIQNFVQLHDIDEDKFKEYFYSFKAIEKDIFKLFFENTINALQQDEGYNSFNPRNKVLSFYYTFFENLAANREYVLVALKSDKKSLKPLKKLSKLKNQFESYINSLEIDRIDFKQETIEKLQTKTLKKSAWFQLLTILKFWMEDTSDSFEKTDVFIEKSINTSFDLIDTKVLKSIIDLGKFIFKEKKHFKL